MVVRYANSFGVWKISIFLEYRLLPFSLFSLLLQSKTKDRYILYNQIYLQRKNKQLNQNTKYCLLYPIVCCIQVCYNEPQLYNDSISFILSIMSKFVIFQFTVTLCQLGWLGNYEKLVLLWFSCFFCLQIRLLYPII